MYNLKHYLVLFFSFYVLLSFGQHSVILYFLAAVPAMQIAHNLTSGVAYLPDQFEFLLAAALKTYIFVDTAHQVYMFANPYNFIQFAAKPWPILALAVAYAVQVGAR